MDLVISNSNILFETEALRRVEPVSKMLLKLNMLYGLVAVSSDFIKKKIREYNITWHIPKVVN